MHLCFLDFNQSGAIDRKDLDLAIQVSQFFLCFINVMIFNENDKSMKGDYGKCFYEQVS